MAFLFDRVSLWRNAPLASLQRNVLVPRPWRGGKYRTYLASGTKSSLPASHPPSPWVSLSLTPTLACTHTHTHSHTFPLSVKGAGMGIFVHVALFSNENLPVFQSIPKQMLGTPSLAILDPSISPVMLDSLSLDICSLDVFT